MSDTLKDLFETFGSIYSPVKLDENLNPDKIRTKAEDLLIDDEYYTNLLTEDAIDNTKYALVYKYAYVTMRLATMVADLRKQQDRKP